MAYARLTSDHSPLISGKTRIWRRACFLPWSGKTSLIAASLLLFRMPKISPLTDRRSKSIKNRGSFYFNKNFFRKAAVFFLEFKMVLLQNKLLFIFWIFGVTMILLMPVLEMLVFCAIYGFYENNVISSYLKSSKFLKGGIGLFLSTYIGKWRKLVQGWKMLKKPFQLVVSTT